MSIEFIEPYNAYAKKRKKTAAEEIFEQNLQTEEIARILNELNSVTNPPNSPPIAQAPAAGPSAGTGGGGSPEPEFFHPVIGTNYAASATGGLTPLTVNFTSPSSRYISPVWDFGDGTSGTGVAVSHTYTTPGNYFVSVTASAGPPIVGSGSYISASTTTVSAGFTATPSPATGSVPLTVTFTNTSTGATSWLWLFGSASNAGGSGQASSSLENPTHTYTTGSREYTVTLQASGSFSQYAVTSSINFVSASA